MVAHFQFNFDDFRNKQFISRSKFIYQINIRPIRIGPQNPSIEFFLYEEFQEIVKLADLLIEFGTIRK